ncbi:MAG: HEAT repeat domain-containing protein [Planctomycetota bacterium]
MSVDGGHWIHALLEWMRGEADTGSAAPEMVQVGLNEASAVDLESCLNVFEHQLADLPVEHDRFRVLTQLIAARTHTILSDEAFEESSCLEADALARLYERLMELESSDAAAHCLQGLAFQADDESMEVLAACLTESPPSSWEQTGVALSPLWNAPYEKLQHFYEALSDGFIQPTTMTVLLDLANYTFRESPEREHLLTPNSKQLGELLDSVIGRLGHLEREPSRFGDSVEEVQQALNESVALSVSLCDAMGLIQDTQAGVPLRKAMDLSHRRIQTEAAGALARLGEKDGKHRLLELAKDSAARLRAVTYADELGFADEVDAEYRHPGALAESQLSSWLAAPDQFGFQPQKIELVDDRTQYWPSFEEPQHCFLFRFEYQLPDLNISNIGIAGPLCQSFQADLGNLPVEDIYAAFAGWQAEHDEIFEVPASQLNAAQRIEVERMEQFLQGLGYDVDEHVAFALFFGETSLVTYLVKDETRFCAVTDGQELVCFPVTDHPASMTPEVVLCLFRGRKLLRTFNP